MKLDKQVVEFLGRQRLMCELLGDGLHGGDGGDPMKWRRLTTFARTAIAFATVTKYW